MATLADIQNIVFNDSKSSKYQCLLVLVLDYGFIFHLTAGLCWIKINLLLLNEILSLVCLVNHLPYNNFVSPFQLELRWPLLG
jgi:hypothetical protein